MIPFLCFIFIAFCIYFVSGTNLDQPLNSKKGLKEGNILNNFL